MGGKDSLPHLELQMRQRLRDWAIRRAVGELAASPACRQQAWDDAVGLFCYDGEPVFDGVSLRRPTAIALVWRGELEDLRISDYLCEFDLGSVEFIVNGVIINAYLSWMDDYLGRLGAPPVAELEDDTSEAPPLDRFNGPTASAGFVRVCRCGPLAFIALDEGGKGVSGSELAAQVVAGVRQLTEQ